MTDHTEVKLLISNLVGKGLDDVVGEILKQNLEENVKTVGGEDLTVADAVTALTENFEEDLLSLFPVLTSIAGFFDSQVKFKVIRKEIDEGKISRMVIPPETKETDDGVQMHVPGIVYTMGFTGHEGIEFVISSNAPEQFLSEVIAGVADMVGGDETLSGKLKGGEGAILKGFFQVDEEIKYDARIIPVGRESVIANGCVAYDSDELKDLFEDTQFYQIFMPDPKGFFPGDENYNVDFGQIVF